MSATFGFLNAALGSLGDRLEPPDGYAGATLSSPNDYGAALPTALHSCTPSLLHSFTPSEPCEKSIPTALHSFTILHSFTLSLLQNHVNKQIPTAAFNGKQARYFQCLEAVTFNGKQARYFQCLEAATSNGNPYTLYIYSVYSTYSIYIQTLNTLYILFIRSIYILDIFYIHTIYILYILYIFLQPFTPSLSFTPSLLHSFTPSLFRSFRTM